MRGPVQEEHGQAGATAAGGPRVLFIDHSGALGGAELYLLDVLQGLPVRARVLLFEDGPFRKRLVEAGVPVRVESAAEHLLSVSRDAGLGRILRALPHLVGLVGRTVHHARRADVVYANSQKALVVGALASLIARRPLIWNVHDVLTTAHFSAFNIRVAVTLANRCAAHVIANSAASYEAFREAGGTTPVTVIHNGIDPHRFEAVTDTEVEALRQSLGLDVDRPVVGVFSRIAQWKGQHVLLDALPELPHVQALFVGGILFRDDEPYLRQLHRTVQVHGLGERVRFLGFRDDIPALMRLVDVVVHTSTAPEPFGRVIVEGMMAKTPVVATRAGGALEIIDHGKTGLLTPPADSKALAAALREVLANPVQAHRLAQDGASSAQRQFSLKAITARIDHVVKQIA